MLPVPRYSVKFAGGSVIVASLKMPLCKVEVKKTSAKILQEQTKNTSQKAPQGKKEKEKEKETTS